MKTQALEELELEVPDQVQIEVNTGLAETARNQIAQGLKKVLADTFCLMLMTQNYHWNVKGMHFREIHEMTEENYHELFEAIDEIAERIRALGFMSPGTMKAFNELTSVNMPNEMLSEMEMIADLLNGHETVARTGRKTLKTAEKGSDAATVDLLTRRLIFHEKTAWMYRSFLEK